MDSCIVCVCHHYAASRVCFHFDTGVSVFEAQLALYVSPGSPEFAPPANASYQPTTFTTTEAQAKATTQMNSFFTLLFETLVVARKFGLENLAVLIEIYMAQRFEGSFSREQLLDLIHVLEGAHAFDLHRLKSHCLHLLSCVTHQEHYLWDDKNVGAQLYGLPPALRNLPQDLQDEVESARTAAGNPTFASYFIREAVIRKDRTAVLRFLEARKSLTQPPCLGLGNLVHYATCQRDVEFLKFLLELGPDPNFQDSQGNTALHVAAALGSPQILEVLIQAGAKTSIRDKDDKIPLDHLRSARRQMRAFNACVGLYDSPVSENFLERNRYEESQWQAAEAILEDNGTENGTGACAASIRNPLDRHKRSGSKAAPTFAFDSLVVDRWWQAGEMPQLQLDTGSLGAGEGGLEFHDALFEFIAPHTSNALRKVQDLEVDVSRNQALEAVESALVQDFEGEQPKDELDKEVLDLTVALEVELGRAGGIIDEEESSV
eukprot:evm.model.scf_4937.1 EVM.evm.TU.scf_4937.1   scf_4937:1550-3019(+)